MARCWLLVLGSNLGSDACVRATLVRLAATGPTTSLTTIQHFPSDDGGSTNYFNVLVTWQQDGDGAAVVAQLKQMELVLGRDRTHPTEVAIDIDLLAECIDGRWHATSHALEKNEFGHATVAALLRQAGLVVLGVASKEG
ncbi:MAG: 2-amino-4-hydroxy-6-hydroxymethyldihydropteridine diphosphokinase [Rhodanobacter sp.]